MSETFRDANTRRKPPTAWHLHRFGPLGFYRGDDWREVTHIGWSNRGLYVRVCWRVFWRRA